MKARFVSAAVGVLLLATVVFLGIRATQDGSSVIWFGLAAAIVAPVGISALGFSFRGSDRRVLEELSKVPDIERLIGQAKSYEEKVALLEEERDRLIETVQAEARREALLQRKDHLETEGRRILGDLEAVDAELTGVEEETGRSEASVEISQLYERLRRVRRGDIVMRIGTRYVTVNRDLVMALPMGRLVWWYLKTVQQILRSASTRGDHPRRPGR